MSRSLVNLVDEVGLNSRVNTLEGAASTIKNYIPNAVFNSNTPPVAGWSLFNTTIDSTTKVPTGSVVAGAAGFNTLVTTATTPLSGLYSLSVSTAAGVTITTTGYGFISSAFTIDREDAAKVLTFSFMYEAATGTMNFSGTSSNTWAVYIRDVSGGTWIQPAGVYNLTQSSGVGLCAGTFQTTATGTQYQIAVMMVNTVSAAVSMKFDSFKLGPHVVQYGAPVTDWQTFTPTGGWTTNTTYAGRWRRVGDSMEVSGRVSLAGAPNAAALVVNLPSGFSIDTTKLSSTASVKQLGVLTWFDAAVPSNQTGLVVYSSATAVSLQGQRLSSASNHDIAPINATTPKTFASGDQIDFTFSVPILGWSSTVQMSNDTDTRVVAASFSVTGSHTSSGSFQAIPSLTVRGDTHGMISGTTVTIPVSGWYDFSGNIGFSSNAVGIRDVQIAFSPTPSGVPFSPTTQFSSPQVALTGGQTHVGVGGAIYINAGTQITFNAYQNSGGNLAYGDTLLTIKRLSGPSAIAASETVVASYKSSVATTITTAGVVVPFATKEIDSHGAFLTDTYTIPVSGTFEIFAQLSLAASLTSNLRVDVRKNGSAIASGLIYNLSGTNAQLTTPITKLAQFIAGDTVTILGRASTNTNLIADANYVFFHIKRVGN